MWLFQYFYSRFFIERLKESQTKEKGEELVAVLLMIFDIAEYAGNEKTIENCPYIGSGDFTNTIDRMENLSEKDIDDMIESSQYISLIVYFGVALSFLSIDRRYDAYFMTYHFCRSIFVEKYGEGLYEKGSLC